MKRYINGIKEVMAQNSLSKEQSEEINDCLDGIETEYEDLKGDNETLNKNNDRLRETIEEKNETIDSLEEELLEYFRTSTLPSKTLEDENKNKILLSLHKNCTLEEIEILEQSAKEHNREGRPYVEL
ncbi:MAG TPA: hypothetical protein ACFYEK_01235 [Candidatus Wunengus sp. YC60]|uniref:hypothetical protein n=1 Tax=Candidatus Wunengus sp. YC60 TaxID=3367697 RepID=UPI004026E3A4